MDAGNMKPLNVLVVDDAPANRKLMSVMLKKMGYSVLLAEDGVQALAFCENSLPDLVLMDVQMPTMNGIEVVREMRQRYQAWFPILFLSAQTANQDVVEGLRAGGDDYLFKPVQYEILKAKMHIFHVRLEQNNRLLDYKERIEEEADTARIFIEQFTALGKISDPCVRFLLKPAEHFSGDMIAFARTQDGCLHALLADSAGHGLTAALAVIPITHPFYQMTAKGFDIVSILNELNGRVRDYLPLPRFVATAVLSINPDTGVIQVWNGGLPPVLVMNEDGGTVLHSFKSRQLPLGVLSGAEFDTSLEYYNLPGEHAKVLMCTDGATEIRTADGQMLGQSGFLRHAMQARPAELFDRLVETIEGQLADSPPSDDIALIAIDCPAAEITEPRIPQVKKADAEIAACTHSESMASMWDFSLLLKAEQLKRLDVVPFLLGIVRQIEDGQADSKLFLVLSELFNNALDHGVLKLDSMLKNQPDGMELYFSQRAKRIAELETGQIALRLEKLSGDACSYLKISLSDSGDGFDFPHVLKCDMAANQQRHGRGIGLLLGICDSLQYSGNGSDVIAYLKV
jgi:two-component system, HptB-dependent secretion and biofilm response regulator